MSSGESVRKVRERIDNYVQTVSALWAVVSITTWDVKTRKVRVNCRWALGRRMTAKGARSDITPDLTVQIGPTYGIAAEAKRTLPADEVLWTATIKQLMAYDTALLGWWTSDEQVNHDVVVLIHQSLGPRFATHLRKQLAAARDVRFRRELCIIEFGLSEQVNQRMFICLRHGKLLDSESSERLEHGVMVPMERVLATYGPRHFYDSPPEPEYLMAFIWQDFVAPARQGRARDEGGKIEIPLAISAMTTELQRAYGAQSDGARAVEYPKQAWVRQAMDAFVALKLARKVDDENYVVTHKNYSGDLVERFHGFRKREAARARASSRRGPTRRRAGGSNLELF